MSKNQYSNIKDNRKKNPNSKAPTMEIKNECVIDKKLFTEAVRASYSTRRLVDFILAAITFILGSVVMIVKYRADQKIDFAIVFYFIATVILVVLGLTAHLYVAGDKYESICKTYKVKEWKRTTVFFNNRIEMFTIGTRGTEIRYPDITKAYETKHLYVLMSGRDIAVIIRKEPEFFTKGTFEETKDYVQRMLRISLK